MKGTLFILIISTFLVAKSSTLVCYTCVEGDEKCEAKKPNTLPNNTCPPVSEANKKNGMKSKCFKLEKSGNIKRGCTEDDKFCTEEKNKDSKALCSLCERDLCNNAMKNVFNAFVLFSVLIFQLFWIFPF